MLRGKRRAHHSQYGVATPLQEPLDNRFGLSRSEAPSRDDQPGISRYSSEATARKLPSRKTMGLTKLP